MAEMPIDVTLGLGDGGRPTVIVEDGRMASDLSELLELAPGLADPSAALPLARAVNHLSQGDGFAVIEDPAAFEAAYRAKLAAEDPEAPFDERRPRLSDYGVPDFSAIAAPEIGGGRLLFFAADAFIGVPYRVETAVGALPGEGDYAALPLTPVPVPEPPEPESELAPPEDPALSQSARPIRRPD